MSSRPVIFISSVTRELHTTRDLVAKTLLSLGYEPKWEDIAATDAGDLCEILRKWIDGSDAVLQLVGHCYGQGLKKADPDFGECSFTQYEAHYARQKGKQVYYIVLDEAHPTDGCGCEPKTLHEFQAKYRQQVQACGDLYHASNSLAQTEVLVRRLDDKLSQLRSEERQQQRTIRRRLVVGLVLLVVLILGGAWLMRGQHQQSGQLDQVVEQNQKMLEALRQFSPTLAQQTQSGQMEDENARMARAYAVLEEKLQLPKGTLENELPAFAQQLLQRADTSAFDRANALYLTKQYAQAEAEALKAKDHALAAAGKPVQDAIAALELAGNAAQAQIRYPPPSCGGPH